MARPTSPASNYQVRMELTYQNQVYCLDFTNAVLLLRDGKNMLEPDGKSGMLQLAFDSYRLTQRDPA